MIHFETAAAFAALAFVMALSPGPNLMYLASRSACQGARAGFASLAGVCTAMLGYMAATAAGLSAVFDALPLAYDLLRWAGGAYLLWLAAKALRQPRGGAAVALAPQALGLLYRRGLLTCLLNPKVVLMYGALLPAFVQPDAGGVLAQTLQLGLVQIASAACAHSAVILGAARVTARWRRSARGASLQRYVLAGLLTAVALRMVLEGGARPVTGALAPHA